MVTRCKAASVQSGKTQPTVALTQQPKTTKATDRLESNLRLDKSVKGRGGSKQGAGTDDHGISIELQSVSQYLQDA